MKLLTAFDRDLTPVSVTVDDCDYEANKRYRWRINDDDGYVYRNRGEKLMLHRTLLGLSKGDCKLGDHRDRNKLNNQRYNLRVVTHSESMANRAGWKSLPRGVYKVKAGYRAIVTIGRCKHRIGIYPTIANAGVEARAYRLLFMPGAVD